MRVIAISLDGKEHVGSQEQFAGGGTLWQVSATFSGLSLKDVKTFHLQSRPYRWVEFRNVALQPRGIAEKPTPNEALPPAAPGKSEAKAPAVNPAAELKALQGDWTVAHVEKGEFAGSSWPLDRWHGPLSPIDPAAIERFDFSVNSLVLMNFQQGKRVVVGFRINPTIAPKTIDLKFGDDTVALGVYEIQGDRLTLCLAEYHDSLAAEQRPKDLAVEPGSASVLFTLQRYRPPADEKQIQGQWTVISETRNGKAVSEHLASLSFSHDLFKARIQRGGVTESTPFALDAGSEPKQIVFFQSPPGPGRFFLLVGVGGPGEPVKSAIHVIYKFDGQRLIMAYRKDGSPPETFESLPGSGVTLLELEKAKPADSPKPDEPKSGESQTPPNPAINPAAELKALLGDWTVMHLEKGEAAGSSWPVNSRCGSSGDDRRWQFQVARMENAHLVG